MNDDSNRDDNPDDSWFRISRFRPGKQAVPADLKKLLRLLKHADWQVRWNAARELYFLEYPQAVNALIDLLKHDPAESVRRMAAQALGALYEKGVPIPLYQTSTGNPDKVKVNVAVARLQELGVRVGIGKTEYNLQVPHTLGSETYIEIGYLMAQLADVEFPQSYAPLADAPSQVIPWRRDPCVEFREIYPAYMKYFVYRRKK